MKHNKNIIGGFVLILFLLALLVGWTITKPKKEVVENDEIIEKEPAVDLEAMQKRLGPHWKMIRLTQSKWYGPFQMKNGSDWKIAEGEVLVQVNNKRPFLDKPNTNPIVSGKEIKFYPSTETAVLFFMY